MTVDRYLYPAAGVLAATFGVATAHLVAAVVSPPMSPVLAVGAAVIDATPTPVKEWAVSTLGTADKPVLVGGVGLAVLILAAAAGALTRRTRGGGTALLAAVAALAGVAVLTRPTVVAVDLLPTVVATLVAPATLWLLARLIAEAWPSGTPHLDTGDPGDGYDPAARSASRRALLISTTAVAALTLGAGLAGEWVRRGRAGLRDLVVPRAARPLPPLPVGLEGRVDGITPLQTPTGDFYRVDTKLSVPIVDPGGWRLTIDGDVERELSLTYDDLVEGRAGEIVERDITLTCVSNEVGGELVGAARWTGVLLAPLLGRAVPGGSSDQLLSTDVDGFTISTPLPAVLDGRDAMIAVAMNGELLPREHGFPARLVVPGLYGFVGATKWLTRMTLTTYAEERAYWTERDWATQAPIKLSSRIDTPRGLSPITPGRTVVGGVAWAQPVGVRGVEVRIDGGPWQPARLGPQVDDDSWRQWFLVWEATSGTHRLAVRCTDRNGLRQSAVQAKPFPAGSSGIQEIVVVVT